MDDVVGSNDELHHLARGDDHPLVGGEQRRAVEIGAVALVLGPRRVVALFQDIAVEGDAIVRIIVRPIPLVAGDLDRHVRRRRRILRAEQPDRGDCDPDQDEHRNQRPDHLDKGVVRIARRRRIAAAPVAVDRPQQQAEHEDADQGDDAHQPEIVEMRGALSERRNLFFNPQGAGNGHADPGRRDLMADAAIDDRRGSSRGGGRRRSSSFILSRRAGGRLCGRRCKAGRGQGDRPSNQFHSQPRLRAVRLETQVRAPRFGRLYRRGFREPQAPVPDNS